MSPLESDAGRLFQYGVQCSALGRNGVGNPAPPRLAGTPPQVGERSPRRKEKPRGSRGRSHNPLGVLRFPVFVGPGTQLRAGADGRSRRRVRPESRVPVSGNSRPESLRPIRSPDDPEGSPFDRSGLSESPPTEACERSGDLSCGEPHSKVWSASAVSRRSGTSVGCPIDVAGKVNHRAVAHKRESRFVFADCATRGSCLCRPCGTPCSQRETPRELRPKPQPSRGSQRSSVRESGPPNEAIDAVRGLPRSAFGNLSVGREGVKRLHRLLFAPFDDFSRNDLRICQRAFL